MKSKKATPTNPTAAELEELADIYLGLKDPSIPAGSQGFYTERQLQDISRRELAAGIDMERLDDNGKPHGRHRRPSSD